MLGRVVRVGIPLLLVLLVGVGVWMAFSGSRALAAVGDLETAVDDVQAAVDATDLPALQTAAADAQDAARRANDALDGPVWAAVAAIPYVGDTPEVARTTAAALATAADGLTPLLEVSDVLDPASLYVDGRVAVEKLEAAQQPLAAAAADLESAAQTITTAPSTEDGAWVPAQLESQRVEAADQLAQAAQALATASAAVDVLPALLGADGPRTWFVGLQSPAEARGTGGFMGTYVILRADDGRLSLETTGSNTDFEILPELPDFGEQFAARYGDDPRLILNSNLSPHFPYAAEIWQAFAADSLDEQVDVVMATDVIALSYIVEAIGSITLPDGRELNAEQLVEFALSGIYDEFPRPDERKLFQEAIAEETFELLTSGDVPPVALVDAIGRSIGEQRILAWSPEDAEQAELVALPTSGSVAAADGPYAKVAAINGTGSKLEAYLERDISYEAGRCEGADRVQSRLDVTLTSAIPRGVELPRYVVGLADVGRRGPTSTIQLQIHLSPDAAIDSVTVDGEPVAPYAFREQGRPAVLLVVDLKPRQARTISMEINEPATSIEVDIPVQPLALPATVQVSDVPCERAVS